MVAKASKAGDSGQLPPPPQAGSYRCIVVDPPWDQGKTGKRAVRPNQGTNLDYATMTGAEIATVPVADWAAADASLWLWATLSRSRASGRPILQHAFELMEHWGFQYYTLLTWDKGTGPCPFGPYQIVTEHILFGYRGQLVGDKESAGQMQTLFFAPSRRHSEKPAAFYDLVSRHFPGPRLDAFARRRHEGFDAWGDEAQLQPEVQARTLQLL